jgi:hypothetical protein
MDVYIEHRAKKITRADNKVVSDDPGVSRIESRATHAPTLLPAALALSNLCLYEHNEQARAPHTNGLRNVPRRGALSLLQEPLKKTN